MALHIGGGPQRLVDHALETSTSEQCIAIVNDTTSANLRWANNTLTTNGVMHADRRHRDRLPGRRQRLGQRHRGLAGPGACARGERRPRRRPGRRRRGPGRAGRPATPRGTGPTPPGDTSIQVFENFASQLGEAFSQADAEKRILYGFVFHEVTTTYLGSSTGLRLRHVQPTGHYGCTGKNTELTNSAWVGGATRDFARRRRHPDGSRPGDPALAGANDASTCPPGATTRSCRRPRSRTC